MAKRKQLSLETRQSIVALRDEGFSIREIAKKLKISYKGVHYCIQRTEQTGTCQDRIRSGRPRCTTAQEDKYIRASSLRNRCLTGPQLTALLNSTRQKSVSSATVKRRLRDAGLKRQRLKAKAPSETSVQEKKKDKKGKTKQSAV